MTGRFLLLLVFLLGALLGGALTYCWLDGKRRYEEGLRSVNQWNRDRTRYLGSNIPSDHYNSGGSVWRA